MEESSDRTSSVMSSSGMNNKMNSDSGYGSNSNKSNNSQSQRSSGSSKSHQSSSSGSLVSHPGATQPTIEQHVQQAGGGSQGSTANSSKTRSEKDHKRKKKSKGKTSASPKEPEQRASTVVEEGGKKNAPEPPSSSQPTNPPAIPEIPQQASPESRTSAPCDSKALQMAALTHALSCIKKFRDQDLDLNEDSGDEMSTDSIWSEQFGMLKDDLNMTEQQNSFGAVVSMEDGLVVYITEEITQILGYPKDMWMGRSFMDLIHPKDKMAFASQFTFSGGITFPNAGEQNLGQNTPNAIGGLNSSPPQGLESFFCRLRQYRGLKTTGFGVADKAVSFFPFRLTLKLKEIEGAQKAKSPKVLPQEGEPQDMTDKKSVYLFIGATRISSAYQYPEEVPVNPEKFVTRHSATCQFGHLDPSAVKFLGHLPQDVVGQSVLDYYHPDDLLLLREIYEGVMAERGKPFKSKPYRFRVHNGSFATLETDWSCFINPWSWKLEFVIGQHKVVKGPLNPNVFMPPKSEAAHLEDSQESKVLQEQIKHLLAETVTRRIAEPLKQQSSRRKKDLAVLLETLLDQIGNNETSDQSESVGSTPFSVLERDSAMLGEISPHHDDHSGSNQSSETPPSYNQLNYRENIERFFLSHPKTTRESDESADAAKNEVTDSPTGSTEDDESKGSPNGSSDSAIRQSGSQCEHTEASAEATNDSEHPCSLTEDSLLRHNEDMEKYMVRRHRETRGRNASYGSTSHKIGRNKLSEQGNKANHLKRTGNLAGWASTGSSRKANKQAHMELPATDYSESIQPERVSSVNLWPPFSVGMTQGAVTPTYTAGMGSTIPVATIQYLHRAPNTSVAPATPAVLTQPQVPFVGVHNEPQYFPQQRVPCTMPGLANIIYNQSLGTHAYYGQQGRLYTAAAPIIMGTGGGPVMAPVAHGMHPVPAPAPLLPTVPRVIQQLGIPAATIPLRPLMPNLAPMNPVPAGIQLNPLPGPSGLPMMISAPAVVTVPSTFTTSTPSTSPEMCYSLSGQRLVRGQQQARNDVGGNAVSKAAAVLQNVRLTKQVAASLPTKRISNLKATADFSSSDGFGDSSSSSLYSLCRNAQSSDMSSREDKDSYETADRFQSHSSDRFQSHSSDIDHDMIWKNHLEKTQDGCGTHGRRVPRLSKKPPWQQNLDMTPELSFRYEISIADMSEVLRKDLDKLKIMGNQPTLVDEQLGELYNELKMEGKQTDLHLEEGSSPYSASLPSSSTEEDETDTEGKKEKAAVEQENKKRASEGKKNKLTRIDYDKMVQVFEENAPFPKANK